VTVRVLKRPKGRELGATLFAICITAAVFMTQGAGAQTPVTGFSGLNSGQNSKKPIDIESDRLEVDDRTKIAIFSGNVSATQGDLNLRCPVLEVTYENASQSQATASKDKGTAKADKPSKPVQTASANAGSDPISNGQIKSIHATGGKVLFQSKKDSQEATGDEAFYDVKDQKITMTGKEVVLIQKGNIVKGKKLTIDLATGRSSLDTNQRIQAVLKPEGAKPMVNPFTGKSTESSDKEAPEKAPAGQGWTPQGR
jgi:lipopolysaccharide export system protein LptA